jgi:hypothetical protein
LTIYSRSERLIKNSLWRPEASQTSVFLFAIRCVCEIQRDSTKHKFSKRKIMLDIFERVEQYILSFADHNNTQSYANETVRNAITILWPMVCDLQDARNARIYTSCNATAQLTTLACWSASLRFSCFLKLFLSIHPPLFIYYTKTILTHEHYTWIMWIVPR